MKEKQRHQSIFVTTIRFGTGFLSTNNVSTRMSPSFQKLTTIAFNSAAVSLEVWYGCPPKKLAVASRSFPFVPAPPKMP